MTATDKIATEVMAALGTTNAKNVFPRLKALELLAVCGRCGGSGEYSYNAMTGTTCFGCNGAGRKLPKYTPELVSKIKTLWTPEFAANYTAELKRVAECQKIVNKAREMYKHSVVRAEFVRLEKASGLVGWMATNDYVKANHAELYAKYWAVIAVEDKLKKAVDHVNSLNGKIYDKKTRTYTMCDYVALAESLKPLFEEHAKVDQL